jgi:hypothetical protein
MKRKSLRFLIGTTFLSFSFLLISLLALGDGPGGPNGCYTEVTIRSHGNMVTKNCGGGYSAECCFTDPNSMNYCTKPSGQTAYLECGGVTPIGE